jgi:hypothetical protein
MRKASAYNHHARRQAMGKLKLSCGAMTLLALGMGLATTQAQDTLKVAAGQRGNWDTTIAEK